MITLVTGQARTGTSLTMMLLHSGGIPAEFDPEINKSINPYGSFESRKKIISAGQLEGKCYKCLVPQILFDLPLAEYKIIMPTRDPEQIILSRLEAFKGKTLPQNLELQKEMIEKHYKFLRFIVNARPDMQMLEVNYDDYFLKTDETVDLITEFTGGKLNKGRAKKAVDTEQYKVRTRAEAMARIARGGVIK